MYTFLGTMVVVSAILSVILLLFYAGFIWHFWISGYDEKRSDKIWLFVFMIAFGVYINGWHHTNLWLIIPSGIVLLLNFALFRKRWQEYKKDFIGELAVLSLLVGLTLSIFSCRRFEKTQQEYAWEHAETYKVIRFETMTETEDDYITLGDEYPISYKSGTIDVERKYVILSDGNAYCIEKNKGNIKTVYCSQVEDSMRVFNGKIVTNPYD